MDTGNIILFLKKFSFVRLVGTGIVLRVFIAIIDGIFGLQINEVENFNFYIFGLALAYTILWMFNKSYSEEEEQYKFSMNSVQRITNLDFIRGFALLGILVINVIAFGLPLTATTNSSTYGIDNTLDWIVLVISSVFFEQKMMG